MPYINKIHAAISTSQAKNGPIGDYRSAWASINGVNTLIYDGRPKPVYSLGGGNSGGLTSISWSNASKVASHINVERKVGTGVWSELMRFLPPETVSYDDPESSVATYYYRVVPYNVYGAAPEIEHQVLTVIISTSGGGGGGGTPSPTITLNPNIITFLPSERYTSKEVTVTSSTGDFIVVSVHAPDAWFSAARINASKLLITCEYPTSPKSGSVTIQVTNGTTQGYLNVYYDQ